MKKTISCLALLTVALCALAQQPQELPLDANVRYGQLENGLTYYICHNEYNKARCDFYIAQSVGAILEEDDQNGLAHFLEHMAFNSTEHFTKKGIINYFESVGVSFGNDINAHTQLDETVYQIKNVPLTREGIVDTALLALHDWACGILLLPNEIDDERRVICEEWRTRHTANFRLLTKLNALKYPNSQYAKRDVIGDTAIINHFAYDALRAYYEKWYGPDNQALIIVGGIDVDQIEQKIKTLWADVPARKNRGERPLYTVNDNSAPLVAIALDPEARTTRIELEYKHNQLPIEFQNTDQAYLLSLVREFICNMLDLRLYELTSKPNAPFSNAWSDHYEIAKLKDAFTLTSIPKEGYETKALNEMLIQLEKIDRYGFTTDELEIVKTNYLRKIERAYNERNNRFNTPIAEECVTNFLNHKPMPGIEWEYEFAKAVVPQIPIELVNQIAKELIHANPTIAIAGPQKEGVNIPSKEQILAMLEAVHEAEIEAPHEKAIDTVLVKKAPKIGKIKKTNYNEKLGVTEWTLSNGVRVLIKPTTYKQDEIYLYAYSKGGLSLVPTEDLYAASLAPIAVTIMGLGDFSRLNLSKAIIGKEADLSININVNEESIKGPTSIKDFETALQLTYLMFTAPRRDEEEFQSLINLIHNQLQNKYKDPQMVFSDSITLAQTSRPERAIVWNTENLQKVTLDKCLSIYQKRFANPADFTFVLVGNIDPNDKTTQKQICQWLGGLKTTKDREDFGDNYQHASPGIQCHHFTHPMETAKSSNFIQYASRDIPFNLANRLTVQMIANILDRRYFESLREQEGGSYNIDCRGDILIPINDSYLTMQFDTDTAKQSRLIDIIHKEIQAIIDNGPQASDIQKSKEIMSKAFQNLLVGNENWSTIIENYYLYGLDCTDAQSVIDSITAESIQNTLRKLVESGNILEVVMTPAE